MNHAAIYRWLALLGSLGLILMLGLGYGTPGWIAGIPLYLPLPGLIIKHRYTHAWASMLVIFYLGFLASEVAAPQQVSWTIHAALLASLASFIGCMMYVRVTRSK